jgi:tRNA(Ile)-lysidine synthase
VIHPLFALAQPPELPARLRAQVEAQSLFRPGERVLVAVSGGPDSVALLHLLVRLGPAWDLALGVAHFDHGLRGEASREEARFVGKLAASLGLPFHPGQGQVGEWAKAHKLSLQMAARELRLGFLQGLRREHGYHLIALGHTADDQVEQFFLRVVRGTGPEGLKGMWPRTPEGLVRPLWGVGKEVLLAWLRHEGLAYRLDPSNLSRAYLRNRVRLDLIPALLRDYNPRLREAVWRLMALLQEDERYLSGEASALLKRVARRLNPQLTLINISSFLALPAALRGRVLNLALSPFLSGQELTAAQLEAVLSLARGAKSGGSLRWGECLVSRAGPELQVCRVLTCPEENWQAGLEAPGAAEAGGWRLVVTEHRGAAVPPRPWPPAQVWLDGGRVQFPLILRGRRPGDRFRPEGGPGSRKLQDVFTDARIPRWLRPRLPVVASPQGPLWIPGLRLAAGVAAGPGSSRVWHLTLQPLGEAGRQVWEHFLGLRKNQAEPR